MFRRLQIAPILSLLFLGFAAEPSWACTALETLRGGSFTALSAEAVEDLVFSAEEDLSCLGGAESAVGRVAAQIEIARGDNLLAAGKMDAAREAWRTALDYDPSYWLARTREGEAKLANGDAQTALHHLERALTAIHDATDEEAPSDQVIAEIWRLAETSKLLAEEPVAPPSTRSGKPGGLALASVRSFTPLAHVYPIRFAYNSDALQGEDVEHAEAMLEFLRRENIQRVELAGHADARGRFEYNCDLSRRRAQAVADYLATHGYGGRIDVVARCHSEPYPAAPSRDAYQQEQLWQMDRRVEISRAK